MSENKRTQLHAGANIAAPTGVTFEAFEPGQGGTRPSRSGYYLVELTEIGYYTSRFGAERGDTEIVVNGKIADPNAAAEDNGKAVEMTAGVIGKYGEKAGKRAGQPVLDQAYQLRVAMGECTNEQIQAEIANGVPFDAGMWADKYQAMIKAGQKIYLACYAKYRVADDKKAEVFIAHDWTRPITRAQYDQLVADGKQLGLTVAEFETKQATEIALRKSKLIGGGVANGAGAPGGFQTTPNFGAPNFGTPNFGGFASPTGMAAPMTPGAPMLGGIPGVPQVPGAAGANPATTAALMGGGFGNSI